MMGNIPIQASPKSRHQLVFVVIRLLLIVTEENLMNGWYQLLEESERVRLVGIILTLFLLIYHISNVVTDVLKSN